MFLDRDGGCVRENRHGMYGSSMDIITFIYSWIKLVLAEGSGAQEGYAHELGCE